MICAIRNVAEAAPVAVTEKVAYLVSQGVATERVKTSAWGETRPSTGATECEDANNPKNVAIKLYPDADGSGPGISATPNTGPSVFTRTSR